VGKDLVADWICTEARRQTQELERGFRAGKMWAPKQTRGVVNGRKCGRDRGKKANRPGAKPSPPTGMYGIRVEGRSGGPAMMEGPGWEGFGSHEAGEREAGIGVTGE
jgi:hypothetical protein